LIIYFWWIFFTPWILFWECSAWFPRHLVWASGRS